MKVVINPAYNYLSDIIRKLPNRKFSEDELIRNTRNTLYRLEAGEEVFVVKKYRKPTIFNQFVYSFFRKTKGRRAYEYAFRLQELGVETPDPVAYIECKKKGIFHTGYFVSPMSSYASVKDAATTCSENEYNAILADFVTFTVALHEKGVMHYDYNTSNVLYYKGKEKYEFSLIDINQMRFGKLSSSDCLRCLNALGFPLPTLTKFVEQYALLRGEDPLEYCTSIFFRRVARKKRRARKRAFQAKIHHPIRVFFGKKKLTT